MDNITEQGKHYQDSLKEAFAAPEDAPEFAAGVRGRWEDSMREYLIDPVAPIRKRYERFKKRYARTLKGEHPQEIGEKYGIVDDLCGEIEECLQIAIGCRARLVEIAEKAGIKLKKGIVL